MPGKIRTGTCSKSPAKPDTNVSVLQCVWITSICRSWTKRRTAERSCVSNWRITRNGTVGRPICRACSSTHLPGRQAIVTLWPRNWSWRERFKTCSSVPPQLGKPVANCKMESGCDVSFILSHRLRQGCLLRVRILMSVPRQRELFPGEVHSCKPPVGQNGTSGNGTARKARC